jgi:predicted phage baseplate assembly protein
MLVHVPAETIVDPVRPLKDLSTRSADDFSVAILDAWAVTVDVVTFYQERIANEGFLRTATERRSVLELGRAIGYELNPGVAASAFLSFTVEDAAGAPGVATVPQATKIQSIPAPGQLPQTFETSADLTARAEYNALTPRLSRPQELAVQKPAEGAPRLLLLGRTTGFGGSANVIPLGRADLPTVFPLDPSLAPTLTHPLTAVEAQLIYLSGTNTGVKEGQPLLFVGKRDTEVAPLVLVARQVTVEGERSRTRIDLVAEPALPSFTTIFWALGIIDLEPRLFVRTEVEAIVRSQQWHERDLSAFLTIQGWSGRNLVRYINTIDPIRIWRPPPPPPEHVDVAAGVFGFSTHAGFFGNNAPDYNALPTPKPGVPAWTLDYSIWKANTGNSPYYTDTSSHLGPADAYLERSFPDVAGGSWALFEASSGGRFTPFWVRDVLDRSVTGFTLSGKVTGLRLADATGKSLTDDDTAKPPRFGIGTITAHIQSQPLTLAGLPIEDPLAAGDTQLELDGLVLGLQVGQAVLLTGERSDLPAIMASEALILSDIIHNGGFTTLQFAKTPLQNPYARKTVTLSGNVALATHGETISETLGSGDGSKSFQSFKLTHPPLTYVAAETTSGARSTLEVRVDGILWQQAPTLYGHDGHSETYVVRRSDDGTTRVRFGDGDVGARLPTGVENVRAAYRGGIGISGMVPAGSLTLLRTRPLGVRSVTNPLPASGAADPEDRDAARTNTPLTVMTLGRIVSLGDYEDFARAFTGIAKTQAIPLWDGKRRFVHLTIAAAAAPAADPSEPTGPPATHVVAPASSLYRDLVSAIQDAHDPSQSFRVDSYQPLFFNVRAQLLVDAPRFDKAAVFAAAEAALKEAFSFDRRAFAQPVTAAEVETTIQKVPGVIAVDLRELFVYGNIRPMPIGMVQTVPEVLVSLPARWAPAIRPLVLLIGPARPRSRQPAPNRLLPAQLLLINPAGITLEEMTP